jgi:hypothetical protein
MYKNIIIEFVIILRNRWFIILVFYRTITITGILTAPGFHSELQICDPSGIQHYLCNLRNLWFGLF